MDVCTYIPIMVLYVFLVSILSFYSFTSSILFINEINKIKHLILNDLQKDFLL